MDFGLILTIYIKLFFLMTPFFIVSFFITITSDIDKNTKKALIIKYTFAVMLTCIILLFFGSYIFAIFGITLDAFRVGTGILLFLTAVSLMQGDRKDSLSREFDDTVAIVPLAIPITIGPGTIGALLVMSGDISHNIELISGIIAIILASLTISTMLLFSSTIEKIMGKQGLAVLSKITALVLSALAAQIILTGVKNFLEL